MPDKYTAVWVSHTSISDFLKCPRSYYLKNVYKDPKTKHKIQLMAPPLALGSAVHEVLESLSVIPTDKRFDEPLLEKFERAWKKISGKKGGFLSADVEATYKRRGEAMLRRVQENPGPLTRLAVKIKEDLPHYWLSEEDNIILCGKIDWLEYFPDSDSVHIIDFKTSKTEEDGGSLQLPIYHLLVHNCQRRKVDGASYWYLDLNDDLTPKELPDLVEAHETVLKVARDIKTARNLERYRCPHGEEGCYACRPMERILKGEGEFVGENDYRQDVYILPPASKEDEEESIIL
ncbi:PD-(D/E)XK nuclease family protein [Candidatus Woesebacteria bacterium]|nr:PD-(D/E)XK nuclease family protein [Candidatus Woesebacteria bacterium]MCD8507606.1 PD-(D/E)XK nuclease family protein [Candidatus Woesebacteria bacterium]MCD8527450.1 PD-(D/E)XK nuclease family protein [Candidatus Woesebacteria bacterium]MCD8546192.1 PD-(D/E)XK nuclease family protein [Candidatus Woesebacteria bacterium]